MSLLCQLSARHLLANRKRTLLTVLGIALAVAMVTAISGFIVSFQDLLYEDSVLREGLWHAEYQNVDDETAGKISAEDAVKEAAFTLAEDQRVLRVLFEKEDRALFDRSEEIAIRYGVAQEEVRYHNNLLMARGIIPGAYYESLYGFAGILLSLVTVAFVMVIGNAFAISAAERGRQFGLLKSVGATGDQIRATVLWEGALLGAVAIPLGILAGFFAQWVALTAANHIIAGMEAVQFLSVFRVRFSPWTILLAVGSAFATIFLAAWLPARKASRQSAIDAIRQTADYKIRGGDVRTLPFVGKLFGFEGLLAAKTMRRNRGRYRITVISLAVSIVLYIGVASFGDMLQRASSMVYEDYGSNILVRLHGDDTAKQEQLAAKVMALSDGEFYPFRELQGRTVITDGMMTANGLEMLESGEKRVSFYSLSDERFREICESLWLGSADLSDPESPAAILINTSGTYIRAGRRHNFTPYKDMVNSELSLTIAGTPRTIPIAGETNEIPTEIALLYAANNVNLIVPESVVAGWTPENLTLPLSITAMSTGSDAFEEAANALLETEMGHNNYSVINYEKMAANNRNIWLLIMIFIYGFIAMLSLISVTNVVTTVSTGIALRKRELAMLRSVGMTGPELAKSLRYESMIYAGKSLAFGLPLGVGASVLMYYALDVSMSFEYALPWASIAISVAAILLLSFATMAYAASKQRGTGIAGVLQDEIV